MLKIAICDDDEGWRLRLGSLTDKIIEEGNSGWKGQIDAFNSGDALISRIQEGAYYDILLLDIEMPGTDGMEAAANIKGLLPHLLVIFITSYEKYVYESFRVQPYRFIPKSRIEEMLPKALPEALHDIKKHQEQTAYYFETTQGMELIHIDDILYLWHYGKYVYLEKTDGKSVKIRRNLKNVTCQLDMNRFVWLTRGCVCNMSHVIRIKGFDLELEGGKMLQISRERLQEVKERLQEFLHQ